MLTQEYLKSILFYNPDTGGFNRIKNVKGMKQDHVGWVNNKGYLRTGIKRKEYMIHRLAWLYVYGVMPKNQIDHINGVRSDNRICNLRESTNAENQQNQRKPKSNNQSGFLGVLMCKRDGNFKARIGINGEYKWLGIFNTAIEAHEAYLEEKRKLHGFCTI